jgi:hypothetical protein
MEIVRKISAGAKLAPAFLIFLYFLFICFDILTTYVSSPDLKYEANWIIRLFNLGWTFLILIDFFIYSLVIISLFIIKNYLNNDYCISINSGLKTIFFEILTNWRLLLSIIGLGIFYSHIINLGLTIINNCLSYNYLSGKDNWVSNTSILYLKNQNLFLILIQIISIIIGYTVAIKEVYIFLAHKRLYC